MPNNLVGTEKQILGMALEHLRLGLFQLPKCLNYKYDPVPSGVRSTIEIPVPVGRGAPYQITPGHLPKQAGDVQIAERQIKVDRYKGIDFQLTDVESLESGVRSLPIQVETAIDSMAQDICEDIIATLYKRSYGSVGQVGVIPFTAGTGPWNNTRIASQAKRVLKDQRTPTSPGALKAFISTQAQAEAFELRAFQDASWNGVGSVLKDGMIPVHPLGFDWMCPQVLPRHTAGTANGYLVNSATVSTDSNLDIDGQEVYQVPVDTGTGDFAEGDIFNVAGDAQDYVVVNWNPATRVITHLPRPQVAWADNAVITTKYADHDVNLFFHKNAGAFVTRPIEAAVPDSLNVSIGNMRDQLTGIVMTLEVSRQYNQTHWELKTLYGIEALRHEYLCRAVE